MQLSHQFTVLNCTYCWFVEKNEEGEIIALELIKQRVQLHKAKYVEECVKNGEMQESEENKQWIDNIPKYEERIKQLEGISEVPLVRQKVFKVLRKYLIYHNWTQLHFLYVWIWSNGDK